MLRKLFYLGTYNSAVILSEAKNLPAFYSKIDERSFASVGMTNFFLYLFIALGPPKPPEWFVTK